MTTTAITDSEVTLKNRRQEREVKMSLNHDKTIRHDFGSGLTITTDDQRHELENTRVEHPVRITSFI